MAKYKSDEWRANISAARKRQYPSLAVRFFSYVSEAENGCWEWCGAKNEDGYGFCWNGSGYDRTHRLAWIIAHGSVPNGMFVLHKCDNPPCVRLDHLFLGTNLDNIADRHVKGRSASNEKNGMAKIDRYIAKEIVTKYAEGGISYRELAVTYGLSKSQICSIVKGASWSTAP